MCWRRALFLVHTNQPKDFDSFLWPLVEELLKLAARIKTFGLSSDEVFALRAFLILIFGDIPAVSMVMRMKGHNGLVPCRMCKITALRTPNSRSPVHYVPLHRARHTAIKNDHTATHIYDPANLPLRAHGDSRHRPRCSNGSKTAQSNLMFSQRIRASKAFPFFHTFHPYFSLIPSPTISCTLSSRAS